MPNRRDEYPDTTPHSILSWYQSIAENLSKADSALEEIFMGGHDPLLLRQLSRLLSSIRADLYWLPITFFNNSDIKKIRPYEECLEIAMSRSDKRQIDSEMEARDKGYVESCLNQEDRFLALSEEWWDVRAIFVKNNWFSDLHHRLSAKEFDYGKAAEKALGGTEWDG